MDTLQNLRIHAEKSAVRRVCQSLHGIDFGRDGSPAQDSYGRVVEAELADEELYEQIKRVRDYIDA